MYLDLTTPWLSFCFPGLLLLVGYITNQTFPHPLSEDQETSCLRRFRNGDEEARNLLIEHNLRLVAHILKKFDGTGEDTDDLISIGTIGLIQSAMTSSKLEKIEEEEKEEVEEVFRKALEAKGPVLIECVIDSDDKVWPMVAPGAAIDDVKTAADFD